jgi:hypothetical protein
MNSRSMLCSAPRAVSRISSARAVGTIALPLRTSSSSWNTVRSLRSAALIAGCVWFIRVATRVRFRSVSSVTSTRSR